MENDAYSIKELVNMIYELKIELAKTQTLIQKYNGLREKQSKYENAQDELIIRLKTVEDNIDAKKQSKKDKVEDRADQSQGNDGGVEAMGMNLLWLCQFLFRNLIEGQADHGKVGQKIEKQKLTGKHGKKSHQQGSDGYCIKISEIGN